MKLQLFLKCTLLIVTIVMIGCLGFTASASQGLQTDETQSVLEWLAANWELVLLVSSELLAFLPAKYTGIVKGLLTIIGKVILWLARKSNK